LFLILLQSQNWDSVFFLIIFVQYSNSFSVIDLFDRFLIRSASQFHSVLLHLLFVRTIASWFCLCLFPNLRVCDSVTIAIFFSLDPLFVLYCSISNSIDHSIHVTRSKSFLLVVFSRILGIHNSNSTSLFRFWIGFILNTWWSSFGLDVGIAFLAVFMFLLQFLWLI